MSLTERPIALVTGSSRGLGRAIAGCLARSGYDIVLHDIAADKLAEFGEGRDISDAVAEVAAFGVRCTSVLGDITSRDQVRRMFAEAESSLGPIDVLVNNAGGDIAAQGGRRPDPNDGSGVQPDDLRAVLERNFVGTVFCCQEAAGRMRARGHGSIVNIASLDGLRPVVVGVAYACAKAAVIQYTQCLATELRPHNVRVNAVAPGPTRTSRFAATRDVPSEEGLSDLERVAEPAEIGDVVAFLAGSGSRHISGDTILASGGLR